MTSPGPSLDEIVRARTLLEGVSIRTPMEGARWLSKVAGGPVLLKAENLQRAGAFKIRGAYTRMARMSPEDQAKGVVAASAGNHAQGVALAGQLLGIDVKDQRQLAIAFVDSVDATYPSLFDPRGEVALAFRGFPANVVPSTILLDHEGRVAAVYTGVVTQDDLRSALDSLLREAGA